MLRNVVGRLVSPCVTVGVHHVGIRVFLPCPAPNSSSSYSTSRAKCYNPLMWFYFTRVGFLWKYFRARFVLCNVVQDLISGVGNRKLEFWKNSGISEQGNPFEHNEGCDVQNLAYGVIQAY